MVAVLVTGGAGYVGSQTCRALAAAGFLPVTYDNFSTGHKEAVRWGPMIEADLSDQAKLATAFREHDIQGVLHFAGSIEVKESNQWPIRYMQNNISNTLTLLSAMVEARISAFVFSSSCAVYGDPDHVPIDENHTKNPVSCYGFSKLGVEQALEWAARAHDFRFACLRYFNAAGADAEGSLGESHSPESHLLPLLIETALGNRSHFEIYGNDWKTNDGTCVRDFIHVIDLADAHVLALTHLLRNGPSVSLNLGSGVGHSVLQVLQAVEAISGRKINSIIKDRRAGDPPLLIADSRLAQTALGWKPRVSNLENIVGTAWRWHLNRRY